MGQFAGGVNGAPLSGDPARGKLGWRRALRHAPPLAFILVLVGWTVFVLRFLPAEIVDALGIRNGYAAAFVLAFLGGLSTFSAIPYHLVVVMLGAGGLNPLLLGLSAGTGVILGDTTSYLVGYHGRRILPAQLQRAFQKFCGWCLTRPSWLVPGALFLYGALVPISNDFIVISMGLARYPYWRLIVPLGLGNIVFNVGAALVGAYGVSSLL